MTRLVPPPSGYPPSAFHNHSSGGGSHKQIGVSAKDNVHISNIAYGDGVVVQIAGHLSDEVIQAVSDTACGRYAQDNKGPQTENEEAAPSWGQDTSQSSSNLFAQLISPKAEDPMSLLLQGRLKYFRELEEVRNSSFLASVGPVQEAITLIMSVVKRICRLLVDRLTPTSGGGEEAINFGLLTTVSMYHVVTVLSSSRRSIEGLEKIQNLRDSPATTLEDTIICLSDYVQLFKDDSHLQHTLTMLGRQDNGPSIRTEDIVADCMKLHEMLVQDSEEQQRQGGFHYPDYFHNTTTTDNDFQCAAVVTGRDGISKVIVERGQGESVVGYWGGRT